MELINNSTDNGDRFIPVINKLIDNNALSDSLRAGAYAERASAFASRPNNESSDQVEASFAESIRLDPFNPTTFLARAQFYKSSNPPRSAADLSRFRELQEAEKVNQEAWLLATSPDNSARNGRRARELAIQACAATNYKQWYHVGTLAAAYAEAGDFEHAIEWVRKATELAPETERPMCRVRLRSYENKKPWREE